jgi:hypothetical protein
MPASGKAGASLFLFGIRSNASWSIRLVFTKPPNGRASSLRLATDAIVKTRSRGKRAHSSAATTSAMPAFGRSMIQKERVRVFRELERFPAKRVPVRVKKTRQNKKPEPAIQSERNRLSQTRKRFCAEIMLKQEDGDFVALATSRSAGADAANRLIARRDRDAAECLIRSLGPQSRSPLRRRAACWKTSRWSRCSALPRPPRWT